MRILHIGKYYAPQRGGIERHTQALAQWCVAAGDQVGVLVHQRPGHWRGTQETIAGVDVRRTGCIAAPVYTPISPLFAFELAQVLRERQPDVLHLHFPNPSCFAVLASPAARRLPWIVHWHADVPPDSPDWRLRTAYRVYRPFEQATLARARAIVATSQAYLDASVALAPWHAKASASCVRSLLHAASPIASSLLASSTMTRLRRPTRAQTLSYCLRWIAARRSGWFCWKPCVRACRLSPVQSQARAWARW